ncbi:MAG: hypothetical protein ABIN67_24605 [Ferruginibacter sp.]
MELKKYYHKRSAFLVCSLLLCSSIVLAQTQKGPYTKLFFHFGFKNCRVYILNEKDTLYKAILNRRHASGATAIVPIQKIKGFKIKLNICGINKLLIIKAGKFYTISILENKIVIEELDEEPLYVQAFNFILDFMT